MKTPSAFLFTPSISLLPSLRHGLQTKSNDPLGTMISSRKISWENRLNDRFSFTSCCCYESYSDSVEYEEGDDSEAISQFGTFQYWDDMYVGMGDFPQDEYSWYFGWEVIKPFFKEYVPVGGGKDKDNNPRILVPGVGNDPILLDLLGDGYKELTAFDYTKNAIDRQHDLLSYKPDMLDYVTLRVMDARKLDDDWKENKFCAVIEKGALDAIYLSGEGNVEKAVSEMKQVVKSGGIFMSVSGVVPEELRRQLFNTDDWEWVRDGSDDLKAGCFIFRRK